MTGSDRPRRNDSPVVGLIDESSPVAGSGVYYVLTTAVVIESENVLTDLTSMFDAVPGRKRPFHWRKEGPEMRDRMIQLILDHAVVAHIRWQPVGRRQQVQARRNLLVGLVGDLISENVDHLVIEEGDKHTNQRDKDTLLDYARHHGDISFTYEWRSKHEPLLWIPDAIGGAAGEWLLDTDRSWYDRLHQGSVVPSSPTTTT